MTLVLMMIVIVLALIAAALAGWLWMRERGWKRLAAAAEQTADTRAIRLRDAEAAAAEAQEQRAALEEQLEAADARAADAARRLAEVQANAARPPAPDTGDREWRDQTARLAEQLAGQVVAALSEAEQAGSAAREAFARISADAGEAAAGAAAIADGGGVTHVAERATEVMGGFVQGMLTTARQVSQSAAQIQSLVAVSQSLCGLLDEVEGVADQTALLSLNASLEAARAGQAGRGFAVVAGEVRKLSERSRQAAERMRGLTTEITEASGAVHQELGLSAERSLEESSQAQTEINHLLKLMQDGGEATQRAVSSLGEKNRRVSDEIERVAAAFQFHDLLRQRLEHVADPLCGLRDFLRGDAASNEGTQDAASLAYAVGQAPFSARAFGAAPPLEIVSYSADKDDSTALF